MSVSVITRLSQTATTGSRKSRQLTMAAAVANADFNLSGGVGLAVAGIGSRCFACPVRLSLEAGAPLRAAPGMARAGVGPRLTRGGLPPL
ncbi:MAG: hypothetical protein ACYDGX_06685 [Thermoleophilia bacterium]